MGEFIKKYRSRYNKLLGGNLAGRQFTLRSTDANDGVYIENSHVLVRLHEKNHRQLFGLLLGSIIQHACTNK